MGLLQLIEINKLEVIGSDNMYDDMIDIEYPFDLKHKRMSDYDRCSQFMPFSALVGYKEAISETARITSERIILDDELKKVLDNKINIIMSKLPFNDVGIMYFIPDTKKSGGKYEYIIGVVSKIDLYNGIIVIDGNKIQISDVVDINNDIVDNM